MNSEKKATSYFLGLDIGTDSIGYAVANEQYGLRKFKGEPMWGTTVFEAAKLCGERRNFRIARRRINRRQQRVKLIQEIFAKEVSRVDPGFFVRIQNSALFRQEAGERYTLFNDDEYNDTHYQKEYPTIHHLICELMSKVSPHDVRLVYLACSWLVAHRGHFLSEIRSTNIEELLDFHAVYGDFIDFFIENKYNLPWDLHNERALGEILKKKSGISQKEKELIALLYGGRKPSEESSDTFPFSRHCIVKLLCGGSVPLKDLFKNENYADLKSISLAKKEEDFAEIIGQLNDDAELLLKLKILYDWSILVDVLSGAKSISEAKVKIYEQHKRDLAYLKAFVKKYINNKYDEIFRNNCDKHNYVSYSYNIKSCNPPSNNNIDVKKIDKEDFSKYLLSLIKDIIPEAHDVTLFEDMKERLKLQKFLPKQIDSENRVIPYQLYKDELIKILNCASSYLPFLNEVDKDGYGTKDKILSVFEFRVPYFVGPLRKDNGTFAWIERKAGKIYPWNFEQIVDLDGSEQAFVNRMTNSCTYMPGEKVLPKNSLCYSSFMVLNEINNLKINDRKISVELKKKLYDHLFMKSKKVTLKAIRNYLIANNVLSHSETEKISGIDDTVKSSLLPFIAFQHLMESGKLTDDQVEEIITRITCTEDKQRINKWLNMHYSFLSEKDIKYISSLKFKDFGRLSKNLLCKLKGYEKETGETFTLMDALWDTNCNLMELLSDRFTFIEEIERLRKAYYAQHPVSLSDRLDELWISNAVKRPIYRALDIVEDVEKATGSAPKKIFIEMARGSSENQKGNRTKTRKDQLLELYEKINSEDKHQLLARLDEMGDIANNQLQSDKLFLYYMQFGKCMYSGESINLELLFNSKAYDIDHIYPQSCVKDDSIINNKVLVLSSLNGKKGDTYPVSPEIQSKMRYFWEYLHHNNLISNEKHKRLIRTTPFSSDEKWGFISRQLVETRQSTKAVATLLGEKYPNCEIVYVKAGLVSDFRHEFEMLKSRQINDLHHAKDAYLNIVVGNVYHERFSKKWFSVEHEDYSLKTKTLFTHPVICGKNTVWDGNEAISLVRKTMQKNSIHFTRYPFCRGGGLFNQQPVKKAAGLVPLKKGSPTEKYGGYKKPTASFFVLAKYWVGSKSEIMVVPVELLFSKQFLADGDFAKEYTRRTIGSILGKDITEVEFPMGSRVLKVNTMFSFDGFRACLASKSSGGKSLKIIPMMPFITDSTTENYIKRLESFVAKRQKNTQLVYDARFDKVSAEENIKLYDLYLDKLSKWPYSKRPANPRQTLQAGRNLFLDLDVITQVECLLQIQMLFGRMSEGCDLCAVGGSKKSGSTGNLSTKISNWKKHYQDVRIIDITASGLYEKRSVNLFELL